MYHTKLNTENIDHFLHLFVDQLTLGFQKVAFRNKIRIPEFHILGDIEEPDFAFMDKCFTGKLPAWQMTLSKTWEITILAFFIYLGH